MSDRQDFQIKVVTPKGTVVDKTASFIKVPGINGEIGILPNHSSMVAQLTFGDMIIEVENIKSHYFLPTGIVYVKPDEVLVLVPFIEESIDVDKDRANDAMKRAKERLNTRTKKIDRERARRSLLRSEYRLQIANT